VRSQNQDALKENAMRLYRHVHEHFKSEETFMKNEGFPDLQKHIENHNLMLDNLVELSDKINKNEWRQQDVIKFIRSWIIHILDEDADIKDFLISDKH
jgi:hemerythrin